MTIRLRLTLWYSSLLAATLFIFSVSIYVLVNWNTYFELKGELKKQAESIQVGLQSNPFLSVPQLTLSGQLGRDMYLQLVYFESNDVYTSDNMQAYKMVFPYSKDSKNLEEGFQKVKAKVGNQYLDFFVYQVPLYKSDGTLAVLKQVGAYSGPEENMLANLRTILTLSSMIVLIIAFTFGLFLARKALQPIDRVTKATERIQGGSDLSVRIPLEGSERDEVGRLVHTLNFMLARLEHAYNNLDESYKMQRRFVSDASHELRTPLTTIRGNIELLEKMWKQSGSGRLADLKHSQLALDQTQLELSLEAMQDISAEARRMSTLVNDLLSLARADAGYQMEMDNVEIYPLLEEVARRAQLLPRNAEWIVGDLSPLEGVVVRGNHDYLLQLVFIFIENAFKYTPEGHVELSATTKEGHAGIVVKDTGIGMDPEEVPHIFDRFYRADESRGKTVGTGLGLSIAKWILDEHNASVEVETRAGAGSTFTIWLPVAFSDGPQSSIIERTDRPNG